MNPRLKSIRAGSEFLPKIFRCALGLIALVAGMAGGRVPSAQAQATNAPATAPEYYVKAGLIVLFPQYITLPTNVVSSPESPFIIGVLGDNPFGDVLVTTAAQEKGKRPLQVRHLTRPEEAEGCQMVFISSAESRHEAVWLAALQGKPLVTVGESGHTLERGGMLELTNDHSHLRFNANLAAIRLTGITMTRIVQSAKNFKAQEGAY